MAGDPWPSSWLFLGRRLRDHRCLPVKTFQALTYPPLAYVKSTPFAYTGGYSRKPTAALHWTWYGGWMVVSEDASRVRASLSPYTGHDGPQARWLGVVCVEGGALLVGSEVSVNGSLSPLCTSAVRRLTTQ